MNRFKLLLLFLLCTAAFGTPCTTASLAVYDAGGFSCTVGGTLVFSSFSFSVVSMSGGAVPVSDTAITVTPMITNPKYGLNFASSGWTVTAGQKITYLLTFLIDEPPIIHGEEMDLFDPPTPPGSSTVTNLACVGAAFVGPVCGTSTVTLTTFDTGMSSMLTDTKTFPMTGIVGNRTTITLDASAGGTADITSFTIYALTPEPASGFIAAGGLLLLVIYGRRRLR